MRRMILRRGLGLLGAGALLGDSGLRNAIAMPPSPGVSVSTASELPSSRGENERRALANPIWKKRHAYDRQYYLRQQCWNNQDADLRVLQSTSQAWRASVMYDRITKHNSIVDEFERRVDAIWNEP